MPLIDIHVIRGSCTKEQKLEMMQGATDVIGQVLGEPVKRLTWVRVIEVEEDHWMIGSEVFTLEHVQRLRRGELA